MSLVMHALLEIVLVKKNDLILSFDLPLPDV
jgi:hypothetical protein